MSRELILPLSSLIPFLYSFPISCLSYEGATFDLPVKVFIFDSILCDPYISTRSPNLKAVWQRLSRAYVRVPEHLISTRSLPVRLKIRFSIQNEHMNTLGLIFRYKGVNFSKSRSQPNL